MRRRGRTPPPGTRYPVRPHTTPGSDLLLDYTPPGTIRISPVPQEWRDHADQPWRILFPDLDWTAPKRDL